jgi:hypothetical protein
VRTRPIKTKGGVKASADADADLICYTGYGARPDWRHTRAQFARIMEKQFAVRCGYDKRKKGCESCTELKKKTNAYYSEMLARYRETGDKQIIDAGAESWYNDTNAQCEACMAAATDRECDMDDYITYVGAERGACKESRESVMKKNRILFIKKLPMMVKIFKNQTGSKSAKMKMAALFKKLHIAIPKEWNQ